MKKYHECAMVYGTDSKPVGFFIKTGGIPNGKDGESLGTWVYQKKNSFEQLVQLDQVQYFAWKNEIIVNFSDEEIADAVKNRIPEDRVKEYGQKTFSEFCRLDIQFSEEAIQYAFDTSKSVVAGNLVGIKEGTTNTILIIYIVGNPEKLEDLTRRLKRDGLIDEKSYSAGENAGLLCCIPKHLSRIANGLGIRIAVDPKTAQNVQDTEGFSGIESDRAIQIIQQTQELYEKVMQLYRQQQKQMDESI